MALKEVTSFRILSSVDAPADGFDVSLASSKTFVEAVANEAVELKAGLADPDTGLPMLVSQLTGVVDRYRLQVGSNGTTATAVGRDNLAKTLDGRVRWMFPRSPIENVDLRLIDQVHVGTWKASQIASMLVEKAGLTLAWECRDYTLTTDFSAVGRIYDLLHQLVQPWNVTEMFKVDVFVKGTVVFCSPRKGATTSAELVIDVGATPKKIRASELSIEKRKLRLIGRVSMTNGAGGDGDGGGGTVLQNFIKEEESLAETFESSGALKSRTVTVTHTMMPDKIMLDRTSTTWIASGVSTAKQKEERTEWDWAPSAYDSQGRRVKRPKLKGETTRVWGIVDEAWVQTEEQGRSLAYDSKERVIADDETNKSMDSTTGELTPSSRVLKEYTEIASGMTEEVTSTYAWDSGKQQFFLEELKVQRNHGGLQQFGLSGGASGEGGSGSESSETWVETISTDPLAEDVTLSGGGLLTHDDFLFLVSQLRQESGKWQYEIRITQVAIPWAVKGLTVQLVNIPVGKTLRGGVFEADGAISLPPGVLTARSFSYDEGGQSPSATATLTVLAWGDT